jgi:hypothetical protein
MISVRGIFVDLFEQLHWHLKFFGDLGHIADEIVNVNGGRRGAVLVVYTSRIKRSRILHFRRSGVDDNGDLERTVSKVPVDGSRGVNKRLRQYLVV